MTSRLSRRRAFTLIELLIVITIIGILAIGLIPRLTGAQARSRDAIRKSDLQQITGALEYYAQDNSGAYPPTPSGAACLSGLATSLSSYMTLLPSDPSNTGIVTTSTPEECAGGYTYRGLVNSTGTVTGYVLIAELENNSDRGQTGVYEKGSVTSYAYGTVTARTLFGGGYTACTSPTSAAPCLNGDMVYAIGR